MLLGCREGVDLPVSRSESDFDSDMLVPNEVRRCVAFAAMQMANGEMRLVGTVFFLGKEIQGTDRWWHYFVTAKHVIEGIRDKGLTKVFIRLNFKDGQSRWAKTDISAWHFHPTNSRVDAAALRATLPEESDHLVYPLSRIVTPAVIESEQIGHGSEVFLVGLFAHHSGQQRNIPIIRVGNIAALPEEPVETRSGSIDAYLIEARSIGGLSGSPVFVHLGVVRVHEGQLKFSKGGTVFYLLGLMHGHWDVGLSDLDHAAPEADTQGKQRVNMGIGIVVPSEQIREVIDQPAILEKEAKVVAEIKSA